MVNVYLQNLTVKQEEMGIIMNMKKVVFAQFSSVRFVFLWVPGGFLKQHNLS